MKIIKKAVTTGTLLLSLAACNANLETDIKISALLDETTETLDGRLTMEVAACQDYKDSRKPSSSLIQMQQNIPGILEGAKFTECYSKNFKSYAEFLVPISLDKVEDQKLPSDTNFVILANNAPYTTFVIPKQLIQRIENAKKSNPLASSVDLKVSFNITNDTDNDIPFRAYASYIDGAPHIAQSMNFPAGASVKILLSDVSVDIALEGNAPPVMHPAN